MFTLGQWVKHKSGVYGKISKIKEVDGYNILTLVDKDGNLINDYLDINCEQKELNNIKYEVGVLSVQDELPENINTEIEKFVKSLLVDIDPSALVFVCKLKR